MMQIRQNILDMPGYTPGEQPQSGDFIKLNTNENPYAPSEHIQEAIQRVLSRGLQFYPDPMSGEFRHAASEVFHVDPDWVMTGNGSDDILTILTRTFLGEKDLLRLPMPSYILYRSLAQLQGGRAEEIPFTENWDLPDAFFLETPGLKLVYVPNPNSPSGTVLSRERIRTLASALRCPVVVDEAYADFSEENCIDLVREFPNLIITRTLSKSYALAGMRFGFMIAQPQLISQFIKVKDSYNCDALSISIASAALRDREWFTSTREKILATRVRLSHGMQRLGFHTVPSHANFVWCTYPGRQLRPIYEGLKAQNIFVRYMVYPNWGDGLRISVGTDSQINILLERISALLNK